MKRFFPAVLVFLGFLIVFLPHFGLPMEHYRTVTLAYDVPIPRWWTHTELYLGVLLFITSLVALKTKDDAKRRRLLWLSAAIGIFVALQGLLLFSFSSWMYWIPDYKRSYQSEVIKLHTGITPALVTLGLCTLAAAVAGIITQARLKGRALRISISSVASANLFRKPFRTGAVMLISALAAGLTFFGSYVLWTTLSSGSLSVSRFGADVIVVPKGYEPSTRDVILGGEPVEFTMPGKVLDEVRSVSGVVTASPQLYLKTLPYRGCCAVLDMLVVGYDPATDFTVKPWMDYSIVKGPLYPGETILGSHVMRAPGQRIQIFNEYAHVTGMLSNTGLEFFDTSAFISLDYAQELAANFPRAVNEPQIPPGSISSVLVKLTPGADVNEAASRIQKAIPDVDAIPVKSLLPPARLWLLGSVQELWPILGLVWLFSCTVLLVVFFMMFNERLREVGIFRALGARRGSILRMFMSEATFIVGTGSVVGVSLGWLASLAYGHMLTADTTAHYHLPSIGDSALLFAACAVVGVLAGLVSAFFPAYRASGAEPYNAIRKGE
jgi:putative ABC transport system permease protein